MVIPLYRADEIIITKQVADRADRRREATAIHAISTAIVADPASSIDRFLEVAMDLCGGDAAGLSLPVDDGPFPQFEWNALVGIYAPFVGGRVPRDDSPCGLARKAGATVVVSRPGRVFPEFAQVDPPISEGLIVPFYDNGGVFLGTIWVVHTQETKKFCLNDIRVMEHLAIHLVLALKMMREQVGTQRILSIIDGTAPEAVIGTQLMSRDDLADFIEASAFRNSVLASSGDCIKVLDLDARVQFMNKGGVGLMEVGEGQSVIGLHWLDVWEGPEALLARDAFDAARRGEPARFRGAACTFAGTPRYWDVQAMPIRQIDDGEVTHVLVTSRDISDHRKLEEQRELLARELDHRIKNILAVVSAIAHQTFRPPATIDAAANAFSKRLTALGEAQGILTRSNWNTADIGVVVRGALVPYEGGTQQISVRGPEIELPPSKALSLALAVHELSTNAAKYGALSVEGGRVAVEWDVVGLGSDMRLEFSWREENGPAVVAPTVRGFGSKLVERAFAAEFAGQVRINFDRSGVICTLSAPIPTLSAHATA